MKAILCIGLIILGMVATEGVVVDEYDGGEDVFDYSYEVAEEEPPLDVDENDALVCREEEELTAQAASM